MHSLVSPHIFSYSVLRPTFSLRTDLICFKFYPSPVSQLVRKDSNEKCLCDRSSERAIELRLPDCQHKSYEYFCKHTTGLGGLLAYVLLETPIIFGPLDETIGRSLVKVVEIIVLVIR